MMTKAAEKVRSLLDQSGVAYTTERHRPAYTAQEIAAVEHVPGRLFAKAVVLMGDGSPLMVVTTANRRVDLEAVKEATGASSVRLATESEFAPLCPDCERGAEPPFGNVYGMPVWLDEAFDGDEMVFNAGNHVETIRMKTDDYLRLVQPKRAKLS